MEAHSQNVSSRGAIETILGRLTPPPAENCCATENTTASSERIAYARIAFVALASLVSWFKLWQPYPHFDLVGLLCAVAGGYPIFSEAWEDVWSKRMTMELSMSIALTAALIVGEVFTALVILLFVLIAEVLENKTVGRGRQAIYALTNQLPKVVEVRAESETHHKNLAELAAGDVIVIRPGGHIPVDGEVVKGNSSVNQSAITGESLPVEKLSGDSVYAGTLNQAGLLEVRVTRVGLDTAFGRIIEAVERAERSRAPAQRLADRLAAYLVYFALSSACVTLLLTRDARSTISVIIVAGACGVAAGTPLPF